MLRYRSKDLVEKNVVAQQENRMICTWQKGVKRDALMQEICSLFENSATDYLLNNPLNQYFFNFLKTFFSRHGVP